MNKARPFLTNSSPPTQRPISCLIPSLPDDLAILCIARVPRSHHPFLAAVSRAWRSFLRSPLLFSVRLDVGASQHFLFINLRTPNGQSRWYLHDSLRRNHSPPLIPLPAPPLAYALGCTAIGLGHFLFVFGGSLEGILSRHSFSRCVVQIYDARFNCWRLGTPMRASREFAAAGVISGRIYALGGCYPINEYWAEEFNPEKEQWRRISSPPEIRMKWMHGNAVIGGKLLAKADQGDVAFDPAVAATEVALTQEKAWSFVPTPLHLGWRGRAAAVGEVLYSYSNLGKIKGYDFTKDEWRTVEGLDKELPEFVHGSTLVNLGELLCLVWEGRRRGEEMEVSCAGVKVTKTDAGGLQGSVEWSETFVLAFPRGTFIAHCISLEF
ncbi:F-box/kelch-repeat protein SKIP6-like [Phalaenopsis equestris]|uniref:F-box/kelch-repeat protein SKIP6-like n=1 Tax=Phalaenopsis equestris TaxID=78828 RepID=UPI0009E5EDEE|nr:F-box/kelch-repeat protein SKIP6-like [Phalaenopsis equestris]